MEDWGSIPLPERMRPQTLDEYVGQTHLVGEGGVLRNLVDAHRLISLVLWGPPGTGKTTLAKLLANTAHARFIELSAVSSGVKELREAFLQAQEERRFYGTATVLFIDEVHRFTKAQQDILLPAIEQGVVSFIGSTTQNPRICLTPALQSRLQICELIPLTNDEVRLGLLRAATDRDRGLGLAKDMVTEQAWSLLVARSGGDLRKALLGLEWSVVYAKADVGQKVTEAHVQKAMQTAASVDESTLYDLLSAFGKSLRGSDSDAALYWFLRMVEAGVDPRIPVRRLIVHASEDVGLASPSAMAQAVSAMQALEFVGLPEAKIPIAQAIIFVCEAPKSNSVVQALHAAQEALARYPHEAVPVWLRDRHYPRMGDADASYLYPHDFFHHYVKQQYLPQALADEVFYHPGSEGTEARIMPHKLRQGSS